LKEAKEKEDKLKEAKEKEDKIQHDKLKQDKIQQDKLKEAKEKQDKFKEAKEKEVKLKEDKEKEPLAPVKKKKSFAKLPDIAMPAGMGRFMNGITEPMKALEQLLAKEEVVEDSPLDNKFSMKLY